MRLPSINTLETGLRISREDARKVRRILEDASPRKPRTTLEQINDLLGVSNGFFGVECIDGRNGNHFYYLNSGDTYSPTLAWCNWLSDSYQVTTWGDIVERNPGKFPD